MIKQSSITPTTTLRVAPKEAWLVEHLLTLHGLRPPWNADELEVYGVDAYLDEVTLAVRRRAE